MKDTVTNVSRETISELFPQRGMMGTIEEEIQMHNATASMKKDPTTRHLIHDAPHTNFEIANATPDESRDWNYTGGYTHE